MGRNSTRWEDDAGLLTGVARARARLVTAEQGVANLTDSRSTHAIQEKLKQAWTALLNAEISDTLGWSAAAQAVAFSLRASDLALLIATQLIEEVARDEHSDRDPLDERKLPQGPVESGAEAGPTPEMFGVDGHGSFTRINPNVQLYECTFISTAGRFGVRFPFTMDEIVFCPSGLEEQPVRVPLDRLKTDKPTLPLANGLLQVAKGLFLIKHTLFVHVAARIDRKQRVVEFAVDGSTGQKPYQWCFFFVSGTLEYAVTVANIVNCV